MKKHFYYMVFALGTGYFTSCKQGVETYDDFLSFQKLETLPPVAHPANNPSTPDKVKLGKVLFYDPILSGEKDVSCATCHNPKHGFSDGIDLSIGVGGRGLSETRIEGAKGRIPIVGRNSPTVLNAAYNGLLNYHQKYNPLTAPMFWDSRMRSLESQSLGPPTSFNEMRGDAFAEELTYDTLVSRLKNIEEYVDLFERAFGEGEKSISKENIGKAIACFERTIISKNSPYDQYVKGNLNALTLEQKQGLKLFLGKANCVTCHTGPMFSDFGLYSLGIDDNTKRTDRDLGLKNENTFRTPTLRNVSLTAPYMHNGRHATLREVMDFYNKGISENKNILSVDTKIKPLNLSEAEVNAVIAFMNSLTDESFDKEVPVRVPSGLVPGGL